MAIRVHFQDQADHFHTACTFSAIPEDAKLVWIDFENPTKTIKHYSLNDSILLDTTLRNLYLQLRDLKLVITHRNSIYI